EAKRFIDHAVAGAARMQRLINDLLQYSRVDTRGKPFGPVSLDAVFQDALANLKVAVEVSGAVVTADPLPRVKGDAGQLALLLQNLLGNALKFRREEKPRVYLSCQQADGEWVLALQDNGIGIEPEYLDRIFGVFQRLHTRAKYPGTGIGLAICKKIVERHRGRIWVESEPNAGSTFYFTIPQGEAKPS
ncbi:MAG: PAS domain S-box protein, partial [Deltaproteobacteria bacterium]|nr:PAS domain S-box protein [Deltaproteobacteria bacterium]